MRLDDLLKRASQYDENLARDIKDYVHGRKYGLVYEASKPEFVRMWKKPVVRGDIVNILPPRGVMEDTKSENDPSEIVYKVTAISKGKATLRNEETGEVVKASAGDIVALARFDKPIYAGLKEIGRIERGGDKPYHVVIDGENYHALQTLVYAYQGMVDCIYIDPPYNTGASDWKYNNNYVGKDDQYRHSKWLTFMEDRLKLAKKLLNPQDSVLIVTIDEKEYLRLGLLLEQLFPESRIQMISSVIKPEGTQRVNEFSRTNEFIFYVMLGTCVVKPSFCDMTSFDTSAKNDEKLPYRNFRRTNSANVRNSRPNQFYPIFVNKKTGKIDSIGDVMTPDVNQSDIKVPNGCVAVFPIRDSGEEMIWYKTPDSFRSLVKSGYAYAQRKGDSFVIQYLSSGPVSDIENGKIVITGKTDEGELKGYYKETKLTMPKTSWNLKSHIARDYGSLVLKQIFAAQGRFTFPKSLYAVCDTIRLMIEHKPNALVVDFFAGSGTTLHAISLLNAIDKGTRRCICVTNNEVSAKENENLTKQGYRPGDPEWERWGIAQYVTWPRIRCSIEGVDINNKPLIGDYGCTTDGYEEYDGQVIDPETGRAKRKKLFEKIKLPSYPELSNRKMAEGFNENAIFFELEYLEPSVVSADLAYNNVAPILWLCGGCKGKILGRQKGYVVGDTYAILFEYRFVKDFVNSIMDKHSIKTVFIVTDVTEYYQNLYALLPHSEFRVIQLYESYIRAFEINAIG